jgi:pyruvate-formate lyase-activating enzyme
MFDVFEYYNNCSTGDAVDNSGLYAYLKSFGDVILWGASFTGKAIGEKLLSEGVDFTEYWDLRADELQSVIGRRVTPPFAKEYDRKRTLVIICVPNHVVLPQIQQELIHGGYRYLRGDILYSGICCKLNRFTGLSAEHCWASRECRSVICRRAENILKSRFPRSKHGERIDLQYGVFIITSKCNLRCKYCVQFISNYETARMVNVPVENVKRDIALYLGMLDTVGTISVMGGETFLHPDLGEIAREFCKYDNFGFISFPTNGLVPISERQLDGMQDKRIIVPFGAYRHIATERQRETYAKNIELLKKSGVTFVESVTIPTWLDSGKLTRFTDSTECMSVRKKRCPTPPRNLQVRDGRIYCCDRSVAMHAMGAIDYPNDYFELAEPVPLAVKREKFHEYVNKDFYYTCAHCPMVNANSKVPVAEQGKLDVFAPYAPDEVARIIKTIGLNNYVEYVNKDFTYMQERMP